MFKTRFEKIMYVSEMSKYNIHVHDQFVQVA